MQRFILFAALVFSIAGCSERKNSFSRTYELNDSAFAIGVIRESDSERLTRAIYREARVRPFASVDEGAKQLMAGKIDAFVYDEHILRLAMWRYPDRFAILPDPVDTDPSVIAVGWRRKELVGKLNGFIAKYRSNGLYDDMFLRWCHDPGRTGDGVEDMPAIESAPEGSPILRVGTDCDEEPNSFLDGRGMPTGFDVEFARRFGAAEGMRVEIVCEDIEALFTALAAGDIDVIIDNLELDRSRKGVFYTDGYLDSDIMMMVRAEDAKE